MLCFFKPVNSKKIQVHNMLCIKIVFFVCFCFDIQNNICRQHIVNLYFSWNSMKNLSSYYGLTGSRMRASEKDLPVKVLLVSVWIFFGNSNTNS